MIGTDRFPEGSFRNVKKILLTFFAAATLVTAAAVESRAQDTTHTVRAGETLFQIARQYEVTVADLREWNGLQDDELTVGQTLRVRPPLGEGVTHTVEPRETLFSISKRYGVSIAELKRWNNLEGNTLEVGQRLTVFPDDRASDPSGNSLVVDGSARQNTYYVVKSGDSLYEIAREHNMSVEELKSLNDLTSNTIQVGQRLTVRQTAAPPSVRRGEASSPQGAFLSFQLERSRSLADLLERFEMDTAEFRLLNPDLESENFRSGQRVTVLAPPSRTYANPYRINSNLKSLGLTPVNRYSDSETGNTTTNGELYTPSELTAAHSSIALGSVIYVRNPRNRRGVFVRVNDRTEGEGIKISRSAWQALEIGTADPTLNIYQDQ